MANGVLKILRNQTDEPPPVVDEPLAADPKPKRSPVRSGGKASPATVRVIAKDLLVGLKFVAGAWSMRDQHCGPVLNEHARAIADELAEILAEDARVAQWFEHTTGFSKWLRLAMVIQPVAEAIAEHHVFRTVSRETLAAEEVQRDDGALADLPAFHPGERYAS